MIQIEYLITGLRLDVINNKVFTNSQKQELFVILDNCPTIPMSINPVKITIAGKLVKAHLHTYETRYLSFGGNPEALKMVRNDYEKVLITALKGFKNMRR